MDHMDRGSIHFDHVKVVVLDEADEMLNMGFLEDMETILSQLPEERQTLMFSATMPQAIADIAKKFQKDPVTVRVIKKELTVPKVTQYYYEVKAKKQSRGYVPSVRHVLPKAVYHILQHQAPGR